MSPLGPSLCTGHLSTYDGPYPTCCDGVIGTADDVVIHGKDDKEHDKHLHKFMRVAHEHGPVFNRDMCAVKQNSVVF